MAAKLTTRIVDVWVRAACRVQLTFISGEQGVFTVVSRDRWHFETACGCKFNRTDVTHWSRIPAGLA